MDTDTQRDGIRTLARLGYAARGAVYLVVGGLAATAAFAGRGQASGTHDALAELGDHAGGKAVLAVIGAGLLAYAIWRLVQAYHDVDRDGRDVKGVAKRLGFVGAAIGNAVLAVWVFTALLSGGGGGEDGKAQHEWTAWALGLPGGRWLVGLIGAVIIGIGVGQIVKAFRTEFERFLTLDYRRWPWARPLCRFGIAARGVVFVIIGWLFVRAAIDYAPDKAGGVAQAFATLARQPWGWLLLGVVALELVAFGLYSVVVAAYRRIEPPARLATAPG